MPKDIIVVGTSAGGVEALRTLVCGLPENFSASVFVVMHAAASSPGLLALILQRAGELPAVTVRNKQAIRPGVIYVAAPDYHLIVEEGFVDASHGPKENGFRPAVDPLFRSAAYSYGSRVAGVVLTGGLDDGTAGLWAVKQLGGTAIVQDPAEAMVDSMPRSALKHVRVDHCIPVTEMPSLLVRLASESTPEKGSSDVPDAMKIEVKIAKEDMALESGVLTLGEPSHYTCPECHGVLLQLKEENRIRFRCHTGHAYSLESLLEELDNAIEDALWNGVRAMDETVLLMRHFARHLGEGGNQEAAARIAERAERNFERIKLVRQAILTLAPVSQAKTMQHEPGP